MIGLVPRSDERGTQTVDQFRPQPEAAAFSPSDALCMPGVSNCSFKVVLPAAGCHFWQCSQQRAVPSAVPAGTGGPDPAAEPGEGRTDGFWRVCAENRPAPREERLSGGDGDMPGRFVLYSVPIPYISPLAASDECSAVCLAQSSSPVHRTGKQFSRAARNA